MGPVCGVNWWEEGVVGEVKGGRMRKGPSRRRNDGVWLWVWLASVMIGMHRHGSRKKEKEREIERKKIKREGCVLVVVLFSYQYL